MPPCRSSGGPHLAFFSIRIISACTELQVASLLCLMTLLLLLLLLLMAILVLLVM